MCSPDSPFELEQQVLGLKGVKLRAPRPWPEWFTAGKNTPKRLIERVADGLHPMGGPLGPEGARCKTCAHLRRKAWRTEYFKCALVSPQTSTLSTDIRLKWRGCSQYKEKTPCNADTPYL
jgi:hypothetical protein